MLQLRLRGHFLILPPARQTDTVCDIHAPCLSVALLPRLPACAEARTPRTPTCATHSTAVELMLQGTPGSRRGCRFCCKLTLLIHPLVPGKCVSSSSHFPQQCPKQLNTCCRGSQTGLPLTGPSTWWLTFWVLELRPGSPSGRLPWKGKLGELFIWGEFCWLLLLPPALVPVLKLRARLKAFSEQETGNPLQRSRSQLTGPGRLCSKSDAE